jgi:hypothetical protein
LKKVYHIRRKNTRFGAKKSQERKKHPKHLEKQCFSLTENPFRGIMILINEPYPSPFSCGFFPPESIPQRTSASQKKGEKQ